ncbi:MAG: hypothetical protein K2G73_09150 [Eubacterium sp.]|nr:hypothetical protein [Eubacterium sp.]MDE5974820.1 hypothetical protein [Eubacterium sp.]
MSKHKLSIIFLALINIVSYAAGIITQVKLITNGDVTSIIPITVDMTVDQILMLNFMAVSIVLTLISIVTTYLVVDVKCTFGEILSNCAAVFMIVPILVLFVAVFNAVNAPVMIDKLSVAAAAVFYVLLSAVNVGCVLTVREDEKL